MCSLRLEPSLTRHEASRGSRGVRRPAVEAAHTSLQPSHGATDLTPSASGRARTGGTRQVFGLMSEAETLIDTAPRPGLLTVASQDRSQCVMTAVVLTYRCGAAPESNRIPCCHERPGWPPEPCTSTTIYGNNTVVTTQHLVFEMNLGRTYAPTLVAPVACTEQRGTSGRRSETSMDHGTQRSTRLVVLCRPRPCERWGGDGVMRVISVVDPAARRWSFGGGTVQP